MTFDLGRWLLTSLTSEGSLDATMIKVWLKSSDACGRYGLMLTFFIDTDNNSGKSNQYVPFLPRQATKNTASKTISHMLLWLMHYSGQVKSHKSEMWFSMVKISWNALKFPERMCFPILLCTVEFPENKKFLAKFPEIRKSPEKSHLWQVFSANLGDFQSRFQCTKDHLMIKQMMVQLVLIKLCEFSKKYPT